MSFPDQPEMTSDVSQIPVFPRLFLDYILMREVLFTSTLQMKKLSNWGPLMQTITWGPPQYLSCSDCMGGGEEEGSLPRACVW